MGESGARVALRITGEGTHLSQITDGGGCCSRRLAKPESVDAQSSSDRINASQTYTESTRAHLVSYLVIINCYVKTKNRRMDNQQKQRTATHHPKITSLLITISR